MAVRIALFYAAIFLFVGIHLPFWPVWLTSRGVGAAEIGIVLSAAAWIRAFAQPLIAQAADRRGERKRLIVALMMATLAGTALYAAADGFWEILGVSVLVAIVFSAVMPLGENLAMLSAHRNGFDYGRVRLWGSLTFIVGATFGGRLLVGREADLILWLLLGTLALSVVAALMLPDFRAPPVEKKHAPISRLLRNRVFIVFLLAVGFTQASHAVYYGFATLAWTAAGISNDIIGALWAEGVVAEVILFAFSGAVARRLGPVKLLAIGVVGGLVRWVTLGLTADLGILAVVQLLHAATFAATHLAAMHFLLRAIPAEFSATAQGLYAGLATGVLMGLAMIVAGTLYAAFGGAAFLAMAALSLTGGLAAIALARLWKGGEIV